MSIFSRTLASAALLLATASAASAIQPRAIDPDELQGIAEWNGDPIFTPAPTSTPAPGGHQGNTGCRRHCSDELHACQIDISTSYQECRASAYEHANWLIQYNGTIDFAMLADMLEACDYLANTTGDTCGQIYEACLGGCG